MCIKTTNVPTLSISGPYLQKFQAYEVVEDKGQQYITTRWVVTEKEQHDGLKVRTKARLVLRGYMESTKPRSDSPTASHEMLKVGLAIAANEQWDLECLDA